MDNILIFQKIIEQESKTSTYKFALLRAVIDIIVAQSPHIEERENQVAIPVFLITDKWLFYYWDLIAKGYAQIHYQRSLVFEKDILDIQNINESKFLNYWEFNKEFHKHKFNPVFRSDFVSLAKKLNETIIKNPVTYIGTSMGKGYNALFQTESGKMMRNNSLNGYLDLLNSSPKLLMDRSHYVTLKEYGGLLSGTNSIIMNWVDFMDKHRKSENNGEVQDSAVYYGKPTPLSILLQSETMERDTTEIRNFWLNRIKSGETVYCTWSGKPIKEVNDLAIDHAIPFSVLFNNDYWNLMPAHKKVNGEKTDFILSKNQVQKSNTQILEAWKSYQDDDLISEVFKAQCQISLSKTKDFSLEKLLEKFLEINQGFIDFRGMESWEWGAKSKDLEK
jgi:hypothetical protein